MNINKLNFESITDLKKVLKMPIIPEVYKAIPEAGALIHNHGRKLTYNPAMQRYVSADYIRYGRFEELMNNNEKLEKEYNQYIHKKILQKKQSDLAKAHISKSDSNMEFVNFLLENKKFYDWAVVGLYYSIYYCALALLSKKGFSSKNHNATLCFLIKNFSEFSKDEIELIDELQIKGRK